jgi:sec-independent protein translocase protein TatA
MNLFGVGPTEVFVVLIIILVLFGPDKLPEMAKKIGGASRELRDSLDAISEQMNTALENSMELDKAKMIPPAETLAAENPPAETTPTGSPTSASPSLTVENAAAAEPVPPDNPPASGS